MPAKKRASLETRDLKQTIDDPTLNQAFRLAHSLFLCREQDRRIALQIVIEAVNGVETRLLAQDEADRHDPRKPTKVRWSMGQWLQLLIYCKSERYERQQEANQEASIGEEDMLMRYVKHLVLISCRRNSFYITLGISRLLYDYGAAETMSIYDFVFQDLDRSTRKSDAYYRARKNLLIEELLRRFHEFLRINHVARGEKRFQTRSDSGRFNSVVVRCLELLTPWETSCELPNHVDTWSPVQALQSNQVNQIHSIIHPNCFAQIASALKLDPPQSRLMLPRFFQEGSSDGTSAPHDALEKPSDLSQEEIATIRHKLKEEKDKRKQFVPAVLIVLADGAQRARLDLTVSRRAKFEIEAGVVAIEFLGQNDTEEVLLGTHILTFEDDDRANELSADYAIVLEGGQKISLRVSSGGNEAVIAAPFAIDVEYQETDSERARVFATQQHSYSPLTTLRQWINLPSLGPKWAIILVALVLAGIVVFVGLRSSSDDSPEIARHEEPSPVVRDRSIVTPGGESQPQTSPIAEASPRTSATTPEPPRQPTPKRTPEDGGTRDQGLRAVQSVVDVSRVFVEGLGGDSFGREIQRKLGEKLPAGRLALAERDLADAAVAGTARRERTRKVPGTDREEEVGTATLELVNASGDRLMRAKRYSGTAEEIASQFVRDLLGAISREERRRKGN